MICFVYWKTMAFKTRAAYAHLKVQLFANKTSSVVYLPFNGQLSNQGNPETQTNCQDWKQNETTTKKPTNLLRLIIWDQLFLICLLSSLFSKNMKMGIKLWVSLSPLNSVHKLMFSCLYFGSFNISSKFGFDHWTWQSPSTDFLKVGTS